MSDQVPLHDVVLEIVDELQKDGSGLSPQRLEHWATVIRAHGEVVDIGIQLIAVGTKVAPSGALGLVQQLAFLAIVACGRQRVVEELEKGGVVSDVAKKIVGEAAGVADPTTAGLQPPDSQGATKKS